MSPNEYEEINNKEEALQLESKVRHAIATRARQKSTCKYALALDIAYPKAVGQEVAAAGCLYDVEQCKTLATHAIKVKAPKFEYIPGFLAFREVPVLAKLIDILLFEAKSQGIDTSQELIFICDGNGTLHPRQCGLACHLGVLFDIPSLGVAKNYHVGVADSESISSDHCSVASLIASLGDERGDKLPLFIRGTLAGHILRTQTSIRPLFVSSGYAIDQDQACIVVLSLCTSFRQPEPIRRADHDANAHLMEA